jgi:hypothetical protein
MLFAWVYAASWQHPQIYSRNDPDHAFSNETLLARVYRKLGIHADDPRARYLQFLTKNNDVCTEEHRGPFLKEHAYRNARNRLTTAYGLGTQDRTGSIRLAAESDVALTEAEINLCRDYAREELNWINNRDSPWPDWLSRGVF